MCLKEGEPICPENTVCQYEPQKEFQYYCKCASGYFAIGLLKNQENIEICTIKESNIQSTITLFSTSSSINVFQSSPLKSWMVRLKFLMVRFLKFLWRLLLF